jgi:hypothetical protein
MIFPSFVTNTLLLVTFRTVLMAIPYFARP